MTDDLPIVKSIKMVRESDIVERLRNSNDRLLMCGQDYSDVVLDAATEIERLRDDIKRRPIVYAVTEEAAKALQKWRNENQEIDKLIKENERLQKALQMICDEPRDVEKTYAELFVDVKIEARKALGEKE